MNVLNDLALGSAFALAVIWLVYPLLVRLLGARSRRDASAGHRISRVSVVLASREGVAAIQQRVRNLLDTEWPADRLEVIVAIDRDAEIDADAIRSVDDRVRVVSADPGGKAGGLNAGVREATGEILVFADTFQYFERSTLPALVAGLNDSCGATSGCLELPEGRSLVRRYWLMERWLRQWEARVHSAVGVTGAGWAMRRELWKPLPEGVLLDDLHTPMRLVLDGHRVGFERNARIFETRAADPAVEYRRKVRTLTGVLQLCAWLPAVLVPGRNPIFAQFLFHKIARLLTPYLLLIIGAWAVIWGMSALGRLAPVVIAAALAMAVWSAFAQRGLGLRVRNAAKELVLIQAAAFMAGVNAMRGRWQVWN